MSPSNTLRSRFGHPKMSNLPLTDQLLYHASHVFHGYIWVYPVLIEQVNDVRPKPFERCFRHSPDRRRPAVCTKGRLAILKAEFGRNHHIVAEWRHSFTQQFLV